MLCTQVPCAQRHSLASCILLLRNDLQCSPEGGCSIRIVRLRGGTGEVVLPLAGGHLHAANEGAAKGCDVLKEPRVPAGMPLREEGSSGLQKCSPDDNLGVHSRRHLKLM